MVNTLTMARAWRIAERAALAFGGSKKSYFSGLWVDYGKAKQAIENLDLDQYLKNYEQKPYPQELPIMVYHEGRHGADFTPEYFPTPSAGSSAWYLINNVFSDDNPDGKNRLWLGRYPDFEDGSDFTTDQVMVSFSHIANNKEPYKSFMKNRKIKWDTGLHMFLWTVSDSPAPDIDLPKIDINTLDINKLKVEYLRGAIDIDTIIKLIKE